MTDNRIRIQVVPDQACPVCGAYWGHPDDKLDWPNRVKVDSDWKCFNPECDVAYYRDGQVIEYELPEDEKQALYDRVHEEVTELMAKSRWISKINSTFPTSKCIPKDAPLPEGWREGVS